jgi:hypothetical protein
MTRTCHKTNVEETTMAKYILIPSLNMFTYALDECEDFLVLDAYLHIKDSKKFDNDKRLNVFEYYHLQEGGMLNDNILLRLNGFLRSLGRSPLTFVNGHTTSFAALRGQDKVQRRQEILDQLRALSPKARSDLISRKEAEASRLPERRAEYPDRPPQSEAGLNRAEIERRRAALAASLKADAQPIGGSARVPDSSGTEEADDREAVPESTVQDNVVELISEISDLRNEVSSLKTMLQNIFKNV